MLVKRRFRVVQLVVGSFALLKLQGDMLQLLLPQSHCFNVNGEYVYE